MNHLRIHGDGFGNGLEAHLLRGFLRLARGDGMRCALSLSAVRPRPASGAARVVPLTDGVRELHVATELRPDELQALLDAAAVEVAATAPLIVFANAEELADAGRLAGLEWPHAAAVVLARPGVPPAELLARVRALLRWAGTESPCGSLSARELSAWFDLPPVPPGGPIVHVGAGFADGTDLVVDAWQRHFAGAGRRLRLVLPEAAAEPSCERLGAARELVELRHGTFAPEHVRDAALVVLPQRRCDATAVLVRALASGRPVCASRTADNAHVLDGRGVCFAVGGRHVVADAANGPHFAPDPAALVDAMRRALGERTAGVTGDRARRHVARELSRPRPAAAPPRLAPLGDARPTVVLEAPFFESSSTSELSLATASALSRRGSVALQLVATPPFRKDLAWLRERAPELEPLFCRNPGRVDLWLASGWPVRAARPACRQFALRVDWEYGALPVALTPHVTELADVVVVHSEHVRRTVVAAGRSGDSVHVVPHGVDPAMHELAPPDPEIAAFKGERPAVLFCGGLVWRKGFDVFLRAALAARAAGHEFVVVVKAIGHDQHYGGFHLGALVERFRATPGTPPLLFVDRELSRAGLASLYTACDVLLHPYRGEGFCLPVLEARAAGLPVLATAGGATDQLMLGPGATTFAAERRAVELPEPCVAAPWVLEPNAPAVAAALAAALADLDARRRAARDEAARVRAAFPWQAAALRLEALAVLARDGRRTTAAAGEPVVLQPAGPLAAGRTLAITAGVR